jgi:hypothetical protein
MKKAVSVKTWAVYRAATDQMTFLADATRVKARNYAKKKGGRAIRVQVTEIRRRRS